MKIKILSSLFLIFIALCANSVHAAMYRFEQGGYFGGGKITGFFEAKDTYGKMDSNHVPGPGPDGYICSNSYSGCYFDPNSHIIKNDEVSISIHFSGSPLFESFNKIVGLQFEDLFLKISDLRLFDLAYSNVAATGILPDEPGSFVYRFGYIRYTSPNLSEPFSYNEHGGPLIVSQVPLPCALIFFLSGLIGLFGLKRRLLEGYS